jgi:hypothetical protein
MEKKSFARKVSGTVELDLCFSCRSIWFDKFESLQIEAVGVIELFRLIGEHGNDQRLPLADKLPCPRCSEFMVPTMDRARSGAFNYLRCPRQHGHFIVFAQFMIEKGFVRQLSGAEIEKLKVGIGVIRCPGCGAPVDIRRDSACPYCHAPIALLDPSAIESALAAYHRDADRKPPDAMLLAEAIIDKQRELARRPQGEVHSDLGDLLIDGVAMAWHLMRS